MIGTPVHQHENRIREWRERRSMSQTELAESVGTTPAQINKLENGDRKLSPEWLWRLGKALDCLPAELLPHTFYRPHLSDAEQRLIDLYRSLDDTEQVRWQKAFAAYCAPISPTDTALTS